MKILLVIVIAFAGLFTVASVYANNVSSKPIHELSPNSMLLDKERVRYIHLKPDFGSYHIEKDLTLVNENQVKDRRVIQRANNGVIVTKNITDKKQFSYNTTVVRNINTGKLAPLSGNIIVLLKEGTSAQGIAEKLGVKVYMKFPDSAIAVFSVPNDKDIVKVYENMVASSSIKSAQIEVLEKKYIPR